MLDVTKTLGVSRRERASPDMSRSEEQVLRARVEDAVAAAIQTADPQQKLRGGDFQDVLEGVTDKVYETLSRANQAFLDEEDHQYINKRVGKMVKAHLDEYVAELTRRYRFRRFERVLCNIGGDRRWASGVVQSIDEEDPADPTGQTKLAYVVKIDPPNGRLISVPRDDNACCLAEVCFGRNAGGLWFTLFCLPSQPKKQPRRRFAVGERVACAVEDESNDFSSWRAGTVLDVDCCIESDAQALLPGRDWSGALVPYRVALDAGATVLVHKDEHWLVRDLALQDEGARQGADGTRALTRLIKRQRGEGVWEAIDHSTRQVRPCAAPEEDEDE